jgi:hypothetical protein
MTVNYKLILLFILAPISFEAAAESPDLPVKFARDDTVIQIKNIGECPIYKLRVETAPPADSGFKRLINMAVGVSFEKDVGTLKENSYITIPRSELINGDGKRLDSSYVIGRWYLDGSHCGDNLSVVFTD